MSDILKFKRGQVWMMRDTVSSSTLKTTNVQRGNRPALIISNDAGNKSSNTLVVIKITSKVRKSVQSINVCYYDDSGNGNVILCNQVCTIDKSDMLEYMYTLSDNIMDQVEKSYKLAMGMQETDIQVKIEEIYRILEDLSVIKSNQMHDTSNDEKVIRDTAKEIANIYNNLAKYHDSTVEQLRASIPSISDNNAKVRMKLNNRQNRESNNSAKITTKNTVNNSDEKAKNKKRKPYGYWTEERIKQFVEDKDILTLDEWMKKYDFNDRKSIMNTYYSHSYKVRSGKVG